MTFIDRRIFIRFLIIVLMVITTTLFLTTCTPSTTDSSQKSDEKEADEEVKSGEFASVLSADFPTDLVFFKDKLFITEKSGKLKVIQRGSKQSKTLKEFKIPSRIGYNEIGLLGIALSPNFEEDKKIYLYHSYEADGELLNKVVSIDSEQPKEDPLVIIDGIRGSRIHNGGKLAFGPDGKLYIATGDAGDKSSAQDTGSLNGKVLRVEPDGGIPSDNPFGNAVWSYGHRNIFGMTWALFLRNGLGVPGDNRLFVTENGPEKNDEINEIKRGGNYGWPEVSGVTKRSFDNPMITIERSIAPTGIIYYVGDKYTALKDQIIFADLVNGDIHEIFLGGDVTQKVIANAGQGVNAIAESPDGEVYVATEDKVKKIDLNSSD